MIGGSNVRRINGVQMNFYMFPSLLYMWKVCSYFFKGMGSRSLGSDSGEQALKPFLGQGKAVDMVWNKFSNANMPLWNQRICFFFETKEKRLHYILKLIIIIYKEIISR